MTSTSSPSRLRADGPRLSFVQQEDVRAGLPADGQPPQDGGLLEREITAGLMQARAAISPKFLYDERGSALFEAITQLPEYYLTRSERSILQRHGESIADSVGPDRTVIEPGAGNCEKARALCLRIQAREFIGMDISFDHLRHAVTRLAQNMPWLRARAVAADITRSLELPADVPRGNRLVFYPGSSIGNFEPAQAVRLLSRMRELLGPAQEEGGLLIGFDLPKPAHLLEAAYDDAAGVTAAFNRNVLEHANRIIGGDFKPDGWKHVALFNAGLSRVEMHLEAVGEQRVRWRGGGRDFASGERIHTENSYKYSRESFASMLGEAGFAHWRSWSDERGFFAVVHAW